jgi:hypothetical protein
VAPNGTSVFATGKHRGYGHCAEVEADVLNTGTYFLKVTPVQHNPVTFYGLSVTLE